MAGHARKRPEWASTRNERADAGRFEITPAARFMRAAGSWHPPLSRSYAVFATPQKNGSGPFAIPVTFLRQA
jgi:hypothetical protein